MGLSFSRTGFRRFAGRSNTARQRVVRGSSSLMTGSAFEQKMTHKNENIKHVPPAREKADSEGLDNRRNCYGASRNANFAAVLSAGFCALTFGLTAFPINAFPANASQDAANPAVDASGEAASDAVGGVDPRRA